MINMLNHGLKFCILPFKIDIIHRDGLNFLEKGKLEDIFEETKEKLIVQLHSAVEKINNFKNENTK